MLHLEKETKCLSRRETRQNFLQKLSCLMLFSVTSKTDVVEVGNIIRNLFFTNYHHPASFNPWKCIWNSLSSFICALMQSNMCLCNYVMYCLLSFFLIILYNNMAFFVQRYPSVFIPRKSSHKFIFHEKRNITSFVTSFVLLLGSKRTFFCI